MGVESYEPYQMSPQEESDLCSRLLGILHHLKEPHDQGEKSIIIGRLGEITQTYGAEENYPAKAQQMLLEIRQLVKTDI